jgi:hypothetical protein
MRNIHGARARCQWPREVTQEATRFAQGDEVFSAMSSLEEGHATGRIIISV